MIVYLYTMYLISKLILNWILFLQFWKGLWWGNSKKKVLKFISEKNVHILYRFACKMINLRNKICHTRDQPLKWWGEGGGCNCNICLITTCLGPMWGTPGVLCWNKYTYSLWFTLGREKVWECHGPTVNVFSLRIWGWWVAMLSWNGWNCHTRIL